MQMIRRNGQKGYLLVTQNDHAVLAGPMAGLVVSWHFTGLSHIAPINGENEAVQNMLQDFSAHQRARQLDYCGALGLSKSLADYPPIPVHQRDQDALYNLWVLRMCD